MTLKMVKFKKRSTIGYAERKSQLVALMQRTKEKSGNS